MLDSNGKRIVYRTVWALVLSLHFSGTVSPEQLPIKTYTTTDSLAHNTVNRIVRDSRGFLWFCTEEGLSRFDGYSLTNYGIEQGPPCALVNGLLETRKGSYWVATAAGLCRFNPLGKPQASNGNRGDKRNAPDVMFTVYFAGDDARPKHVLSLLEDGAGIIWCGTQNGLYRVEEAADDVKLVPVDLGIPDQFESRFIECLLEDRWGALWVGRGPRRAAARKRRIRQGDALCF